MSQPGELENLKEIQADIATDINAAEHEWLISDSTLDLAEYIAKYMVAKGWRKK
jgi:hypothetical protein